MEGYICTKQKRTWKQTGNVIMVRVLLSLADEKIAYWDGVFQKGGRLRAFGLREYQLGGAL